MNTYKWKMESLAKGIPAEQAEKEFERIQKEYGELTSETLLKAATPKKALFHILFEWDDSKAAEQYRMQQARTIINNIEIIVISDGKERNIGAYEIVKSNKGREYKRIDTMTFSEIEYVKDSTLAALKQISAKLKIYRDFDKVVTNVDAAIETLEKTNVQKKKEDDDQELAVA